MNGHFLRFETYIMGVVQKEKVYNKYSGCTSRGLLSFIKFRLSEETVATMHEGRVLA
jgi:hypothetical protein